MKKCWKWIAALVSAGAVLGLILVLLHKRSKKCAHDTDGAGQNGLDEEDLDLDADLTASEEAREYVPLNKTSEQKGASSEDGQKEGSENPEETKETEP